MLVAILDFIRKENFQRNPRVLIKRLHGGTLLVVSFDCQRHHATSRIEYSKRASFKFSTRAIHSSTTQFFIRPIIALFSVVAK